MKIRDENWSEVMNNVAKKYKDPKKFLIQIKKLHGSKSPEEQQLITNNN